LRAGDLCDIVNFIAVPPIGFSQDVLPTSTTSRLVPATGVHPEGLQTAVETKKITATWGDPQGIPVKKRPDACLLSAQRMTIRAPEISQTLPTTVGIRHEKFRTFHSGTVPSGRFFEAGGVFLSFL
jgi:hypothetical protein